MLYRVGEEPVKTLGPEPRGVKASRPFGVKENAAVEEIRPRCTIVNEH